MKKFHTITSTCSFIKTENIDTDQIVPARFLRLTTREGYGKYLFYDWRFDQKGKSKKKDYIDGSINQSSKIMIAGNNFGCGSSREHAVWAITDFGFEVVISSSFGDIFYSNSLKNGLLPVVLKQSELDKLFKIIGKNPKQKMTTDLKKQQVIIGNLVFHFLIDSFRKKCLLQGVDELGYILTMEKKIEEYEKNHLSSIST